MPRRLLIFALLAICSCTSQSKPTEQASQETFVFVDRIGVARWGGNQGCLAVFNARVERQTRVALVGQQAPSETQSVNEATVVERLSQACDAGLSGANSHGVVPTFYQIATAADTAPPAGTVIAILDPPGPLIVREGHVEVDLDGDGAQESFRSCHSAENVHFMAWTGPPPHGEPRWHGRYYLGYEVTPSCSDQEVAGIVAAEKRAALAK
jgi:hypothetical protein